MSGKKVQRKVKISKALFVGLGLIALSILGFGLFWILSDKTDAEMSGYTAITNEEELRNQLDNDPAICKLINMTVTGDIIADSSGMLKDDYIVLRYRKEEYIEREVRSKDSDGNDDSYTVYEWEDIDCEWKDNTADKIVLFDDIVIEPGEYYYNMFFLGDLSEKVKDEFANKDFVYMDYYPNGDGYTVGNIRYSFAGIPVNSNVAFMAKVGDGKIVPVGYKDDVPIIYLNGREEDLSNEMSGEGQGILAALIILVTVPLGIVLIIVGIVRSIKKFLGKD